MYKNVKIVRKLKNEHVTIDSQHSMGSEAACRARTRPGGATGGARGRWVRNTKRTRVFFLPTSVSPFLSSMSEFLSFRIPAQSMLRQKSLHLHLSREGSAARSRFGTLHAGYRQERWKKTLLSFIFQLELSRNCCEIKCHILLYLTLFDG